MVKQRSPKRKIGTPRNSLSDINVYGHFLHKLQSISGGGLTPSMEVELHEMAERLKIFRERAVRKLKLDKHTDTALAEAVGCSATDILNIHTPGEAIG
jgi:hypothetical protein